LTRLSNDDSVVAYFLGHPVVELQHCRFACVAAYYRRRFSALSHEGSVTITTYSSTDGTTYTSYEFISIRRTCDFI